MNELSNTAASLQSRSDLANCGLRFAELNVQYSLLGMQSRFELQTNASETEKDISRQALNKMRMQLEYLQEEMRNRAKIVAQQIFDAA